MRMRFTQKRAALTRQWCSLLTVPGGLLCLLRPAIRSCEDSCTTPSAYSAEKVYVQAAI